MAENERLCCQLRFIERDGKRILQQGIERHVEETDGVSAYSRWRLERWQDVPFVETSDNA